VPVPSQDLGFQHHMWWSFLCSMSWGEKWLFDLFKDIIEPVDWGDSSYITRNRVKTQLATAGFNFQLERRSKMWLWRHMYLTTWCSKMFTNNINRKTNLENRGWYQPIWDIIFTLEYLNKNQTPWKIPETKIIYQNTKYYSTLVKMVKI